MANKRDLKKAIRYACGDIAGECIFAQEVFGQGKEEDWDSIIVDVALLQEEAVNRVTVAFDRAPKDFENRKAYNKARRAYYKEVEKAISNYMHEETENIVKRMNALMPKKA
ncbi:MAG: hypothetical protein J6N71_02195 [Muribaculaceae bacterium]|nr:hypothetical protein [Muribaculaceae bacterium]HAP50035.1 hypothetical protein [Porphyromonadaceae bacterium]